MSNRISDCNLTDHYDYCRDCESAERTIKMLEAQVKKLTQMLVEIDLIKPIQTIIIKENLLK